MNDEAREVLVAAALRGHPQARGAYYDDAGGDCAYNVLHAELHTSRAELIACFQLGPRSFSDRCRDAITARFGVDNTARREIERRNDWEEQDFLTIARKVGHADEPA